MELHLLDHPKIAHFLYQFLPLIDEHNKQQQSLLQLKKRWLTKDPWFRLVCKLVKMAVIDMHRYYRHYSFKVKNISQTKDNAVCVAKFTDMICGDLNQCEHKIQLKEGEFQHWRE